MQIRHAPHPLNQRPDARRMRMRDAHPPFSGENATVYIDKIMPLFRLIRFMGVWYFLLPVGHPSVNK